MRRALLALTAVALLAAALVPVAASAAGHHHRHHRLRTVVAKKVVRHAPRWKARKPLFGTPVSAGSVGSTSTGSGSGSGTVPGTTSKPAATPTPVATPKPPALPGANPHSVSVRAKDASAFSFTLSQQSVKAGTVHVQFDNSVAQDAHQLRIRVKGGATVSDSAKIEAGEVVSEDVTLSAGTYTLLCPLPGHQEAGMEAELTVAP